MLSYLTQPSRLLLARTTSQTLRRWDSSPLAQTRYGDVGADLPVSQAEVRAQRISPSAKLLTSDFWILDSHASSLRPDSASERLQVRFCPLLSPFRPGRGSRGAVERSSSSSWSLERRKAVSLQAQARVFSRKEGFEAKELKIKAGLDSVRFGSSEVQSAKCKIQNPLRKNRRLRNPEAKRDRGTLTRPGMGADWFARMAT